MPWDPVGQIVGDDGISVTLLPSVANAAALPTAGNNPGDARMTQDNGHLHSWDGSQWTDVGQLQGPQGGAGQSITVYQQTAEPPSPNPGDIWIVTNGA